MTDSARATSSGEIEFVFYTDEDAPLPPEFAAGPDVTVLRGPRICLSDMWNECYKAALGDICMQCDDETVFRTGFWDTEVEAAFSQYPDRIIFAHGADLHQPPGGHGSLGFLHRRWADALGYFVPPGFSCDYSDTWLNEVAVALGRRVFLPGVITEHMHPIAGKGTWDQTHLERLARGSRDNVAALYAARAPERQRDIGILRELLQ